MEKQLNKPFVKIVGGFRKVPKIEKKVCQRCGAPLDWQVISIADVVMKTYLIKWTY